MSTLFISQYRLVEDSAKPHYVYVVEIIHAGKRYSAEKRYSAFHSLHRELRKHHQTPVFPPKRVRNTQPKVLEQRRLGLERYLQEMLKTGATKRKILTFFGLNPSQERDDSILVNEVSGDEVDEDDEPVVHEHIFKFDHDPYVEIKDSKDIITTGVLAAFYGDKR